MKKKFLAALCVAAGLLAGGTAEAAVATVDMRALYRQSVVAGFRTARRRTPRSVGTGI